MEKVEEIENSLKALEKYVSSAWGECFIDKGISPLSNILIFYRRDLGITSYELEFILKLLFFEFKGIGFIKDRYLDERSINISRIRKNLIEKGYLKYAINTGADRNRGGRYNLYGFKKSLEKVVKQNREIDKIFLPADYDFDTPNMFDKDNFEIDFVKEDKQADKKENNKEDKKANKTKTKIKIKEIKDKKERTIKDDNSSKPKNQKAEELFLENYQMLHKKLLGTYIEYDKSSKTKQYKEYLLKAYRNRKNDISTAFKEAEKKYLELSSYKKTSLGLQDCLVFALLNSKESYLTVPSGINIACDIFRFAKRGGDIKERYDMWVKRTNKEYYESLNKKEGGYNG